MNENSYSVERSCRAIVLPSPDFTQPSCERGSALQTFAAKITQFAFDELDAPPVIVGARNWITPADEIEDAFFPQPADILDAVREHLLPLRGFAVARDCSTSELLRRSAQGV